MTAPGTGAPGTARSSAARRERASPSRAISRGAASTRPIPSTPGTDAGGGTMKLDFHRDSAGDPRARGKGRAQVVADFLESDLQDSVDAAREVLRAVDDVESGRVPSWERTGNAYTLTLSPKG